MSRFAAAAFKGLGTTLKGLSPDKGTLRRAAGAAFPMSGNPIPSRRLRSLGGKTKRAANFVGLDFSSPGMALAAGVPTAMFLGGMAGGVAQAVKEEFTGFNQDISQQMRQRRYEAAQALKAQRLQQAMAQNMMRLAATNPQLYNQLLVGRTLPQGAVVVGGGQRSDFLESVAYQMATGGFGNPQTSTDSPDVMQALVDSI